MEYNDERVSVDPSVYRQACLRNHNPNFTIFVHVASRRGSVLFWRRCNMLTSGFVYDVVFSYNGPNGGMSLQRLRVTALYPLPTA